MSRRRSPAISARVCRSRSPLGCKLPRDALAEHREVLPAQAELEAAELEDVEVVSAVVVRIALDAAAVSRGDDGSQDVDHEIFLSSGYARRTDRWLVRGTAIKPCFPRLMSSRFSCCRGVPLTSAYLSLPSRRQRRRVQP